MTESTSLLKEIVAGHFLPGPAEEIGLAVSGGGDSMALMHLMAEVAAEGGLRLRVATVDHGLRPEAAEEAAHVGDAAAGLSLPHEVLRWDGAADETGNLQDRARRARYDLLADWARRHGMRQIALGHTSDDQAETFLMRLARAPGADGLSGMAARRRMGAVTLVRPLLEVSRNCLRIYLKSRGLTWVEDPSNQDDRFDRVRARRALEVLRPLGLTVQTLSETAKNMASVRNALGWYAFTEAQRLARIQGGDLVIERSGFRVLQPEIARRLLSQALIWISGSDYPPRRRALAMAQEAVRSGTGMTLHGCQISVTPHELRITREYAAVKDLSVPADGVWDGRWRLSGPWGDCFGAAGAEIRPLGAEGLRLCSEWRASGLPYRSLLGYPSVWMGGELVAAPHAGFGDGWRADLLRGEDALHTGLLAQ